MPLSIAQIETVFANALKVPATKRDEYLRARCRLDAALLDEVNTLLRASETSCFIDTPIFEESLGLFATQSSRLSAGDLLGHYEIMSLLGRGGMGEVYLALDLRLERKVALKFLCRELSANSTARVQLTQEAKAVAKLDHDNICQIYGLEEFGAELFIVMQYIEGETLCSVIQERKSRGYKRPELIRQIVSALAYAHSHGIVHRDIKPQNVMVTSTGKIKLLDFGLALTPGSASRNKRKSANNIAVIGTPRYMSPEQVRGDELDSRSDVFSLGTLMFELVSGKNPFSRKSNRESIAAIQQDPPAALNCRSREERELAKIVTRCLAKNPSDRYQSANEVLKELDVRVFHRPTSSLVYQ